MATEFRCDKCGKALFVDEPPGTQVACPNCARELRVPDQSVQLQTGSRRSSHAPATTDVSAGGMSAEVERIHEDQAAVPTPPPVREAAAASPGDSPLQEAAGDALSDRTVKIISAAMPWGASILLHGSIFLVLLFLFMTRVVMKDSEAERIIIPDARLAENPGAMIDPGQENPDLQSTHAQQKTKVHTPRVQPRKSMLAEVTAKKESGLKIIGIGVGQGGGPSAYGLSAGEGDGPRASFYGSGGNAYKVCYVIDRSGSLLDTFDFLREELKRSIRSLVPQQQFHVIFFAAGKPEEMPAKKLVYATQANKDLAFKYLDSIVPGGQTDPGPALERAIQYKPELIYFMTDGDFQPEILERLRRLNRDKKVKINTLSFIFKPGEELLKQIAQENGGRYKHVSEDDLNQ